MSIDLRGMRETQRASCDPKFEARALQRLILIRHGESIWNRDQRFTGWADVGLTPHGVEQMKAAGRQIREREWPISVCFTSALRRSVEAAGALLSGLGALEIARHRDWRLNERHYGALTGMSKAHAVNLHGPQCVQRWRRSYDYMPPAFDALLHQQQQTGVPMWKRKGAVDPKTESLHDVVLRVAALWNRRLRPALRPDGAVAVVAHGNSLRALRMLIEGIDAAQISACEIDNAAPLIYVFGPCGVLGAPERLPPFKPTPSEIL